MLVLFAVLGIGLGYGAYELFFAPKKLVPGKAYVLDVTRAASGEAPEIVLGAVVALGVFRPLGSRPVELSPTHWQVPVFYDPFAGALSPDLGPHLAGDGKLTLPVTSAHGLGTDLVVTNATEVT